VGNVSEGLGSVNLTFDTRRMFSWRPADFLGFPQADGQRSSLHFLPRAYFANVRWALDRGGGWSGRCSFSRDRNRSTAGSGCGQRLIPSQRPSFVGNSTSVIWTAFRLVARSNMRGLKDATEGGVARKGAGLHYKPVGVFGGCKTVTLLGNPQIAPANLFENPSQYRKLG
jgi:hypothetical protein